MPSGLVQGKAGQSEAASLYAAPSLPREAAAVLADWPRRGLAERRLGPP